LAAALAEDAARITAVPVDESAGYLELGELPNSLALLPPPPAMSSAPESYDQDVARAALALQGSDRFKLAALDADLRFPGAAGTFSCALGAPINVKDTPTLYRLLQRVMSDASNATAVSKKKYRHARPFMLDGEATCQPSEEDELRQNGSYPSGHSSIGWAWAEVLAEIAPDRLDEILERGRAFGKSRIVCNVHLASDVVGGRTIAAATVVRLHADPGFLADMQAAKKELEVLRAKNLPPQRDCKFEDHALKQTR
jgi:acid phosphatase (class A)